METSLLLIPGALLLGFAVNGALAIWGCRGGTLNRPLVSAIGCLAPVVAFFAALNLFVGVAEDGLRISTTMFTWFSAGDFSVALELAADQLTCVMLLVVCGVGSLIHIYSVGYMKEDPGYARYFAFLNLFTFFMTVLVLGADLLVLFVGWEGVGLCSYLLIGFWWKDAEKATAGMKAFVVNRIGDAAFILGMLLLWSTAGTLSFQGLQEFMGTPEGREAMLGATGVFGASVAGVCAFLLFCGATGKSAQIPLYIWLPDAMAGPTPVSALIHAATMVTAGVYMVARLNYLYFLSPAVQGLIILVGGTTCLVAGLMAVAQFDIKKVLAYSTISQIGYMFLGVASGHIGAGIFHLTTHAFFKACLFLGAGSIIAMAHHEQDMRKMGGLRRRMPLTFLAMLLGAAAMAGVPPLSGFFSKDEVLWRAFSSGGLVGFLGWLFGLLCAGLTGFYMFRLIFMTFSGSFRGEHAPKEAPASMTVSQGLLAVGAVLVGFLGVPHLLGGHDRFGHFVEEIVPTWARPAEAAHGGTAVAVEWALILLAAFVGIAGIVAAWWCYVRRPEVPGRIAAAWPRFYQAIYDKFRVDEAYTRWIVDPLSRMAKNFLALKVDGGLIEGIVNGLGRGVLRLGTGLSYGQSGLVRGYVALMVVGTLLILLTLLV